MDVALWQAALGGVALVASTTLPVIVSNRKTRKSVEAMPTAAYDIKDSVIRLHEAVSEIHRHVVHIDERLDQHLSDHEVHRVVPIRNRKRRAM